jgi:hypothetical protein
MIRSLLASITGGQSRQKRRLALRSTQKREWIDYKGGKCMHCGYHRCLQSLVSHHTDPASKRFSISGGGDSRYDLSRETAGRTRAEILEELNRCVLLCCNCHAELHAGSGLYRQNSQSTRLPQV